MALPTQFGTELSGTVFGGAAENTPFITPILKEGRVRYAEFNFATGTTFSYIVNTTVGLLIIPKGAKILKLSLSFGAMGTSATVDIGLMDLLGNVKSATTFATTLSVAAAGVATAAKLDGTSAAQVQGALYVTTEADLLYLTVLGATWAASKTIQGNIEYVVD
jgi:hypothetical protein